MLMRVAAAGRDAADARDTEELLVEAVPAADGRAADDLDIEREAVLEADALLVDEEEATVLFPADAPVRLPVL